MNLSVVLLLLSSSLFSLTLQNRCPPPENVHPCICQEVKPKEIQYWLTCKAIRSLKELLILINSVKGYHFHKFTLSQSSIGYLPSNLFLGVSINEILIQYTNIDNFTQSNENAFIGLEHSLETLIVTRSKLGQDVNLNRIKSLLRLKYLDLSFNNLNIMKSNWFRLPNMELASLRLIGNDVSALPDDAFDQLFKLAVLDLSQNKIREVKRSMFADPSKIVILNLNDNEISSLPTDIFSKMFSLRRIGIASNHLKTFDVDIWLEMFGQVFLLDLTGNPINCDESICWMTKLVVPEMLHGTCEDPPELYGSKLSLLNFWDIANCTLTTHY